MLGGKGTQWLWTASSTSSGSSQCIIGHNSMKYVGNISCQSYPVVLSKYIIGVPVNNSHGSRYCNGQGFVPRQNGASEKGM